MIINRAGVHIYFDELDKLGFSKKEVRNAIQKIKKYFMIISRPKFKAQHFVRKMFTKKLNMTRLKYQDNYF